MIEKPDRKVNGAIAESPSWCGVVERYHACLLRRSWRFESSRRRTAGDRDVGVGDRELRCAAIQELHPYSPSPDPYPLPLRGDGERVSRDFRTVAFRVRIPVAPPTLQRLEGCGAEYGKNLFRKTGPGVESTPLPPLPSSPSSVVFASVA